MQERRLERALIEHLRSLILEPGKGVAFLRPLDFSGKDGLRGMVAKRGFALFLRFRCVSGSGRFPGCRHSRRTAAADCSQKGEECDQRRSRIGQAEILAR